jgi:hypothetical protein
LKDRHDAPTDGPAGQSHPPSHSLPLVAHAAILAFRRSTAKMPFLGRPSIF